MSKSTVLCYNLKGTKKGKKLTMIFGYLGYKIRHVEREEYLWPVGVLAGTMEVLPDMPDYEGDGFLEEMLIMNPGTEDMLDKALFLMRKEKIQVALKAVLTPSNQEWDSMALYEEIYKEHQYMTQRAKERKMED